MVDALVAAMAVLVAGTIMLPSLASTSLIRDLDHVLQGLGHSISSYSSALCFYNFLSTLPGRR